MKNKRTCVRNFEQRIGLVEDNKLITFYVFWSSRNWRRMKHKRVCTHIKQFAEKRRFVCQIARQKFANALQSNKTRRSFLFVHICHLNVHFMNKDIFMIRFYYKHSLCDIFSSERMKNEGRDFSVLFVCLNNWENNLILKKTPYIGSLSIHCT